MGASSFNRTSLYVLMLLKEVAAKLDASWHALRVFPLVATFPRRPSVRPTVAVDAEPTVGAMVGELAVEVAVGVNRSGKLIVVVAIGPRRVDCDGKSTGGDRSGKSK